MDPTAPDFDDIADEDAKAAFVGGSPECVEWLAEGTRLYKWSKSVVGRRGVSPWWFFVEPRILPNGIHFDGLRDRQTYARRLDVHDGVFHRARAAVTKQWNPMTRPIAIKLNYGAWGYIGKCAGQLVDNEDKGLANVLFIGGDYQIWIPNLKASDITQISVLPFLTPSSGRR
jgi:hypothetical protein